MTLTNDTHIVVLMGGPGAEREVSLVSGKAVAEAMRKAGFTHITELDVQGHEIDLPSDTGLVYNVIHGTFGEDGELQEILEQLGIPYTGAGSRSSKIAFDKIASKEVFLKAGVSTPRCCYLDWAEHPGSLPNIPVPLVIKPAREGSSVGIHIVHNSKDLLPALQDAAKHDPHLLIEEFIDGKELTVGILDGVPLPVVHIKPHSGFYDLKNKYPWMNLGGGTDYICPADITQEETQAVQQVAAAAYQAAGIEVYGRVDVLLRASDRQPFVLEINTIPGMTPSSLLPKAAKQAGWSYEELCRYIAELSVKVTRT